MDRLCKDCGSKLKYVSEDLQSGDGTIVTFECENNECKSIVKVHY